MAKFTDGDSILTTGQVSDLCGVSSPTVRRWWDSLDLRGKRSFSIPSVRNTRGMIRIHRQDLEEFLERHGLYIVNGGLSGEK